MSPTSGNLEHNMCTNTYQILEYFCILSARCCARHCSKRHVSWAKALRARLSDKHYRHEKGTPCFHRISSLAPYEMGLQVVSQTLSGLDALRVLRLANTCETRQAKRASISGSAKFTVLLQRRNLLLTPFLALRDRFSAFRPNAGFSQDEYKSTNV